jgi:hypothetical protein
MGFACYLLIILFSEKDTLDVWANGKKLEAMVSVQVKHQQNYMKCLCFSILGDAHSDQTIKFLYIVFSMLFYTILYMYSATH